MFGKLIIFAILGVSLYALFIRLKTRLTGAPPPAPQKIDKRGKKVGSAMMFALVKSKSSLVC